MEKINVLDACAMIAYLRGEPGGDVVKHLIDEESSKNIAHAVNICEVYYDFLRFSNKTEANAAVADLEADGVEVREDLSPAFWKRVGDLKVAYRISLADCFALALTIETGGELVTSDRHEFGKIAAQGIYPITFIR